MMQFTEIPKIPTPNQISLQQTTTMMNKIRPWPSFPTSKPNLSSSSSSSNSNQHLGDANCMEQLLVHCAEAIENNDATPAQQILWVLNNIAPPDGDSNQRLTCAFLRALILRASITPSCKFILNTANNPTPTPTMINNPTQTQTQTQTLASSSAIACGLNQMIHKFSLLDLANFVHLTPWHRFGFTVANSVILEAIEGRTGVHIVDLSVTHCMQIPTLIDAIACRYHGRHPPIVRLTVGAFTQQVPPMFDFISYDDLGNKLINFAHSKGVVLEFKAVPTTPSDGFASVLDEVRTRQQQIRLFYRNHDQDLLLEEEALVVNCQMAVHYLSHTEPEGQMMSTRSMFFKALRCLDPTMVVVVEEDVDFTSRSMVERLRSGFNYFWIPFDTVDTFLPRGSKQREWYEADICWKIENVICHEGDQRVERQEPRAKWAQRMIQAQFRAVGFVGEAVAEVKAMLEEHATGWGSKKEDEDLMLTWKGHNVVFATALVPS